MVEPKNDEVVDMDEVTESFIEHKEEVLDADKEPESDIEEDSDVDEVDDTESDE